MKVGFIQCAIISAVFAIAGYLVFSSASLNANLPMTVALALLVSGIVTPWLASLFGGNQASREVSDAAPSSTATLYVGNLPYKANEDAVKDYFNDHITVQSVRLMKDRRTGKRKGYGFIEVITNDADNAIARLNDMVFDDRTLKVRHAKEKVGE